MIDAVWGIWFVFVFGVGLCLWVFLDLVRRVWWLLVGGQ